MVSVIEVYNAVRDLANKDQKGFVSPRVFNSFAVIAQNSVYNRIMEQLGPAHTLRNRGNDAARGDSVLNGVKDDIARYLKERRLDAVTNTNADVSYNSDNNRFAMPLDLKKVISLRVDNDDRTPVSLIYEPEKIGHILGSHLSSPSEEYPVALVADSIEVFPSDINGVVMTYYRMPRAVNMSGETVTAAPKISVSGTVDADGFFIVDPNTTYNFDLPEEYRDQLVNEIATMVGIRLRDPSLLQKAE